MFLPQSRTHRVKLVQFNIPYTMPSTSTPLGLDEERTEQQQQPGRDQTEHSGEDAPGEGSEDRQGGDHHLPKVTDD